MSITTEELEKLAAYKQSGSFTHEINPGFKGDDTSEHIIRFVPSRRDLPEGGIAFGVSFPVAIAWAWLDRPDDTMQRLADQLNACPDLAKRVIAAEKLVEALRFYANPAIYEPHPHGPAFDRRDVSFSARAALSEWEAGE